MSLSFTTLPPGLSLGEVMEAVTEDRMVGFCMICGVEREMCEPDACNYPCPEDCGDHVFGAEEILIMVVA